MESFIASEIFFFITSIFVFVLIIILCIAGFYFIRIMRDVSSISDTIKKGVDRAGNGIKDTGDLIRKSFLASLIFGKPKDKKKK